MFVRSLVVFLYLFIANNIFAQTQKPFLKIGLETNADYYLNAANFTKKGYAPAYLDNSFGYQIQLKINRYFGKKGWGAYISGVSGQMQQEFYSDVDFTKLSTQPYTGTKIPFSVIGKNYSYLGVGFGVSKSWLLNAKWSIDADLGFEVRKFRKYPPSSYGYLLVGILGDTTKPLFNFSQYAMIHFLEQDFPTLLNLQLKTSYCIWKNHHIFASIGFKRYALLYKGAREYTFKFYNDQQIEVGEAVYKDFQTQLNFGLGYQMTF